MKRSVVPRLAFVAISLGVVALTRGAILLDVSPAGTSAAVGLSPLNEFLAGAHGLGGTGSGGEIASGLSFDPATSSLTVGVGYGSDAGFTDLSGAAFSWFLQGPSSVDRVGPVMVDLAPLHRFASNPGQGGFLDGSVTLTQPQADALLAGWTYLNIYTPDFPGGEIRGQLIPVPEPPVWACALLLSGLPIWRLATGKSGASAAGPISQESAESESSPATRW